MALTMASTLDLSRPSEKLGTHSTSIDIGQKNIRAGLAEASFPAERLSTVVILEPSAFRLAKDPGEPRDVSRSLRHNNRAFGSLPYQTPYRPRQNLPTPTLTCTVFSPGFGTASPAFEICRYRNSTHQLYFAFSTCIPSAAAEVKFSVFV